MLRVPVGTQVLDEDNETVLADLTRPGQRVVLLRGGDGGFGNAHYKTSTNQAPRRADPGWPGAGALGLAAAEADRRCRAGRPAQCRQIDLPRRGRRMPSRRSPTIPSPRCSRSSASSHATTSEFVLADLPGLIEGASEGAGLGTASSAMSSAAPCILHLIDGTEEDVVGAYRTIRGELEAYGHGLAEKPEIVGAQQDRRARPGRRGRAQEARRRWQARRPSGDGASSLLRARRGAGRRRSR